MNRHPSSWCHSPCGIVTQAHFSFPAQQMLLLDQTDTKRLGDKKLVAECIIDTLRLSPRGFFSPSSWRSNFPILAVLIRVVARAWSISFLRSVKGPEVCARFCNLCRSFFAIRALRSSFAVLRGSWSTSVEFRLHSKFCMWVGQRNWKTDQHLQELHAATASRPPYFFPSNPTCRPILVSPRPRFSFHVVFSWCLWQQHISPILWALWVLEEVSHEEGGKQEEAEWPEDHLVRKS